MSNPLILRFMPRFLTFKTYVGVRLFDPTVSCEGLVTKRNYQHLHPPWDFDLLTPWILSNDWILRKISRNPLTLGVDLSTSRLHSNDWILRKIIHIPPHVGGPIYQLPRYLQMTGYLEKLSTSPLTLGARLIDFPI